MLRLVAAVFGLFAAISACDAGPTTVTPPQPISVAAVKARGYVDIMACVDDTTGYDPALRRQALDLIVGSVKAMVQSNWAGASIYLTAVDRDPTAPSATITLRVPQIAAYPAVPVLTPTPVTNPNNPYASAPAQATVGAWDGAAVADYNGRVRDVRNQLAAADALVASWSARVAATTGSASGPADLTACLGLASLRFHDEIGQRLVVVAGNVTDPGAPSGWYSLAGTRVLWVDAACPSLGACNQAEGAWADLLDAYGVAQHTWFDGAESAQLGALFDTPAAG